VIKKNFVPREGDRNKNSGDVVGIGTHPAMTGQEWGQTCGDGDSNNGDGWGSGQVHVPMQLFAAKPC